MADSSGIVLLFAGAAIMGVLTMLVLAYIRDE